MLAGNNLSVTQPATAFIVLLYKQSMCSDFLKLKSGEISHECAYFVLLSSGRIDMSKTCQGLHTSV